MTQEHQYADILRAIADGKQIQDTTDQGWIDVSSDFALKVIARTGGKFLRIKPATITINGCELPKPVPYSNEPPEQFCVTIHGPARKTFYFNSHEDRGAVYAKLCEVLGS